MSELSRNNLKSLKQIATIDTVIIVFDFLF